MRHYFFAAAGRSAQRHNGVERLRGDDHTRRVNTLRSGVVFKLLGRVHHAPHLLVGVVRFFELRTQGKRLVKGHIRRFRHKIGNALPFSGKQPKDTRHVLDGILGLQSAKRSDLRNVPILLPHMLNDRRASVLAQVDINIGKFTAIRIGESLKQKTVTNRTRVGKSQHVANHGADARTTRRRWNAMLTSPVDKVPHNQEVRADCFIRKHLQLTLATCANDRRDAINTVAPNQTSFGKIAQRTVAVGAQCCFGDVSIFGAVKRKQFDGLAIPLEPFSEIAIFRWVILRLLAAMTDAHHRRVLHVLWQRDIASVRNANGVGKRFTFCIVLCKECMHFCWTLDIQLFWIAQSVRRILGASHGDAAQGVMRVVIFLAQEVRVIVAHQWKPQLLGNLLQQWIDALLILYVTLQLNVEARLAVRVWTKVLCVPACFFERGLPVLGLVALDELIKMKRDA